MPVSRLAKLHTWPARKTPYHRLAEHARDTSWRRIPRRRPLGGPSRLRKRGCGRETGKRRDGPALEVCPRSGDLDVPVSVPRGKCRTQAEWDAWWEEEYRRLEDEWSTRAVSTGGEMGVEHQGCGECEPVAADGSVDAGVNSVEGRPAASARGNMGVASREPRRDADALGAAQPLALSQEQCTRNAASRMLTLPRPVQPSVQPCVDTAVSQMQSLNALLAQTTLSLSPPPGLEPTRQNAMRTPSPPQQPAHDARLSSPPELRKEADGSSRPRPRDIWQHMQQLLHGTAHCKTGCRSRVYGFSHPVLLAGRGSCYGAERGEKSVRQQTIDQLRDVKKRESGARMRTKSRRRGGEARDGDAEMEKTRSELAESRHNEYALLRGAGKSESADRQAVARN